jgi:hypothetical protein
MGAGATPVVDKPICTSPTLGYINAMKINLAAKVLSLAGLFLAAGFIAGCRTTTAVDWNSRVGHYTMNRALVELGSPSKQTRLSDGRTVDQWITLHGGNRLPGGPAFAGGTDAMGAAPPVAETYKDHVLELTFDANGELVSWAKNY